jgi:alpha-beta hydrolase superfamily lysophospholipase
MPLGSWAADLPTPKKHVFMTTDRIRLIGDIYTPTAPGLHPAVVLFHQLGKNNADMLPLVAPLLNQGFVVVNVDMRGHGLSLGQGAARISYKNFNASDWAKLPSDLHVVLHNVPTIKDVDAKKLAIIGASINANAAIMQGINEPDLQALVLLSPGLDFHGLKPDSAMNSLHKPALIVAAKDDSYSADSGLKLSKMDKNGSFDLLASGGHGGQMLASHPDLNTQIATWLHKAVH